MNSRSLLSTSATDFRRSWKALALTDVAYKFIAFIVLTSLVGILFRILLATSDKSVLADQDILFFFLGPVGWICFVVVGGLWLGIVALEQAALMGILCAAADGKRLGVIGALRFAAANTRPVILVTARLPVRGGSSWLCAPRRTIAANPRCYWNCDNTVVARHKRYRQSSTSSVSLVTRSV